MTLFTRLTAAALAATCAVGAATAALAHHRTDRQPYVHEETMGLLATARRAGIQIFTDRSNSTKGLCREGLYGMANSNNQLLLCVENHGGDMVELADTVRHELIHNAQFCKGGMIHPELKDKMLAAARDELHMPMDKYEPRKYYREAEARVLAHLMDEHEVADLVTKHCG